MGGLDNEFFRKYKEYLNNIIFFNGIKELLVQLKEMGFRLSIISSNSKDNIMLFLKINNFEVFDDVYSSKGLFGKNYTIKNYMRRYGLKNEEVIYIGDELRDIIACRKAGIDIMSVTWGFDDEELLKSGKPTYVVSDCKEILNIFKGISQR